MKTSMATTSLFKLIALTIALQGCGLTSHGGIIDNGNKSDDGAGPRPDGDEQQAEPTTPVTVLSEFVVDVPANAAPDAAMMESNAISFDGNVIMFAAAEAPCAAKRVKNSADVEIFLCSERKTILGLGEDLYVVAKHTTRNDAIDDVLFSFRRK